MISLTKWTEPKVLIANAQAWTEELMKYVDSDLPIPDNVINRYNHPEVKEQLKRETDEKCAYCESKITAVYWGDIEHIEPKKAAPVKTFQWGNLTYSCAVCNNTKRKYHNPAMPLINPYIDNPKENLLFAGPIVFSHKNGERSKITINKLGLNRPELVSRRQERLDEIALFFNCIGSFENTELKKALLEDVKSFFTDSTKEYSSMCSSAIALHINEHA